MLCIFYMQIQIIIGAPSVVYKWESSDINPLPPILSSPWGWAGGGRRWCESSVVIFVLWQVKIALWELCGIRPQKFRCIELKIWSRFPVFSWYPILRLIYSQKICNQTVFKGKMLNRNRFYTSNDIGLVFILYEVLKFVSLRIVLKFLKL